jgi:hypothetical protein
MYNMYIYVLLLKSNKYYVGKTKNIEQRYKSHTSGNGSYWSSIYKPISMIYHYEVPDHHSSLEETLLTFHMMLNAESIMFVVASILNQLYMINQQSEEYVFQ